MHFLYKNLKIENFEDYPKSHLNVTERKEIKEVLQMVENYLLFGDKHDSNFFE